MSQLVDYIRLKQAREEAVNGELLHAAEAVRLVPDQWAKSHSRLIEEIESANREFKAASEPNYFRFQPQSVSSQHRYAQGELSHFGALERPLSTALIAVEFTGDMIFQPAVDGKRLEPKTMRLEPDFPWGEVLAEIYKRDERLDER